MDIPVRAPGYAHQRTTLPPIQNTRGYNRKCGSGERLICRPALGSLSMSTISSGNGSTRFNEDVIAVVDESGFFDVTMRPRPNLQFRHRLICHIVFMPTYPKQSVPVLDAVGRRGEKLGFPQNPQAHVISGGYYLSETIYVP